MIAKLEDVRKLFGGRAALDGLSFNLEPGHVYGFLGENGAGKTTALRSLMGLYGLDGGAIRVFGEDPREFQLSTKARVAYLPEDDFLPKWMCPRELGDFHGAHFPTWDADWYRDLLDCFGLPEKKKVGALSKGNRRRAAIALTLATRAELLLLDEPASGLDPNARGDFIAALMSLTLNGDTTILFSTHALGDIEKAADHVLIITHGRLALDEELDTLRDSLHRVRPAGALNVGEVKRNFEVLGSDQDIRDGDFLVRGNDREAVEGKLRKLDPLVHVLPFSLEALFRCVTQRDGR